MLVRLKIDYNAKTSQIEDTNADINIVENKIIKVSDLVKNTDYDAKISEIEGIYFTTSDYDKFTWEIIDAMILSGFINDSYLINKRETWAAKRELRRN